MLKVKAQLVASFYTPLRGIGITALMLTLLTAAGCASNNSSNNNSSTDATVGKLCEPNAPLTDYYSQRQLLGVGYEAMQKGNLECAERVLTEANRMDSKDPWALLNLGVVRQRQGNTAQARLAYQMAAAVDPKTSGIDLQAQAKSGQVQEVAVAAGSKDAINQSAGEIALDNLKNLR